MNARQYVSEYLPHRFGMHPCWGKVAEWIFDQEAENNPVFAQDNFPNAEERSKLAVPYPVDDLKELARVRLVAELIILYHRSYGKEHREDHAERIRYILENIIFTEEESKMIDRMMAKPEDFWGG